MQPAKASDTFPGPRQYRSARRVWKSHRPIFMGILIIVLAVAAGGILGYWAYEITKSLYGPTV
jgi:hypothetical protein